MHRLLLLVFFPRSQKLLYFHQIVNDNIELGNACSLYQVLFFKPNDDWLQANGKKLNPQLFWNDDLHLSKTGYQKFVTSLFNFISSCNTYKSTSFDLRKIDNPFPPLSKTNIHITTEKIVHRFKNTSFVSLSIFTNYLCVVYMFAKFLYLHLLLPFVLLVLPFLFQPILVNQI